MPFLFAAITVAVILLTLALFGGKGGPRETAPAKAPAEAGSWLSRLNVDGLEKLLNRLFAAMRFQVEESEVSRGQLNMTVVDPAPLVGGRVHVHGVVQADHGMVEEAEVQAALDEARGEGLSKAVVVSPLGFSAEARLAVRGTACELVDGESLLALVKKHLPEADESAGAGYL